MFNLLECHSEVFYECFVVFMARRKVFWKPSLEVRPFGIHPFSNALDIPTDCKESFSFLKITKIPLFPNSGFVYIRALSSLLSSWLCRKFNYIYCCYRSIMKNLKKKKRKESTAYHNFGVLFQRSLKYKFITLKYIQPCHNLPF